MILKIDHIAYASDSFDADISRFKGFGYEPQFVERTLRDLPNKQPFMEEFDGTLQMALLVRAGSLSVEVINHGHIVESASYLLPIIDGMPLDSSRSSDGELTGDQQFVSVKGVFPRPGFLVPRTESACDFRLNKLMVLTKDVVSASEFWGHFGFRRVRANPTGHLEFRSFLGGTTEMFMHPAGGNETSSLLDSHGFNCLAFFSTDVAKDRVRLEQAGLKPTELNALSINGKQLCIHWVLGPGGEIVEVIGLA